MLNGLQRRSGGILGWLRAHAPHAVVPLLAASCWLIFATHTGPLSEEDRKLSFVVDFRSYYRPNAEYLGARLAAGELPLWNPQQGLGAPFLATLQPGVLYPPNALHAWLPAQTVFVSLAALHMALAAALSGALARRLGATAVGGACTGVLYVGSVTFLQSVWTPPLLAASALAPAVLLAVDRAISRPSAARATMLGVTAALQLVAGWPLMVVMTAYASALYAAVRLATSAKARLARAATLFCGGALGAALAAPLLLPAYELAARSTRSLGSVDRSQAVWLDSSHDLSLILGQLLQWGASGGLPGVPALALAALALFGAGARFARLAALAVTALCFQLASFPNDFGVYDAMRSLPLLGDFRFPFHYREASTLLVAVLAGVGLSRIPTSAGGALRALAAALAVGVPLWNVGAMFVSMPREGEPGLRLSEKLQQVAAAPDANHPQRVFWSNGQGKLGPPSPFHALYDLEPLTLARTAELATFLEAGVPIQVEDAAYRPPGVPAPPDEKKRALVPYYGRSRLPADPARAALLDLLSVDWIITGPAPAWTSERFVRIGRSGELGIYRNPRAMPRVYRVAAAEPEPELLADALARLVAPDFEGSKRVMLSPQPADLGGAAHDGTSDGVVEVLDYAAERVQLRTRGTTSGAVVLTDAWYPGWETRVDGRPAPMLRANTAFRAVEVGPGEHEVELLYRPASFRAGLWLALAAILGSTAAILVGRRSASTAS